MKSKLNCVLLIDDDEPTNFLNKWIIEHSGIANHVQVSPGGQDALDFLTAIHAANEEPTKAVFPCLIFLDINMPAMNGWEFLEKYRQLEFHQHFQSKIVMLTTSLFPEDIMKAANDPEIVGFESKPLTPEMLARVIEMYFPLN